jgi:hypothetical protein
MGWFLTLEIRLLNPELYKILRDWTDTDLIEVGEPEEVQ